MQSKRKNLQVANLQASPCCAAEYSMTLILQLVRLWTLIFKNSPTLLCNGREDFASVRLSARRRQKETHTRRTVKHPSHSWRNATSTSTIIIVITFIIIVFVVIGIKTAARAGQQLPCLLSRKVCWIRTASNHVLVLEPNRNAAAGWSTATTATAAVVHTFWWQHRRGVQ